MSYFVIPQFTKYKVFNRYVLRSYFQKLRPQLYCTNKDDAYNRREELKGKFRDKRKKLKENFIKDLQRKKLKVEEIIERENIWTIPNFLCVGRILTTPCIGYLIISQNYELALWFLGLAGLSDLADGWIARTWISQASKIGSFLDPVADKLLIGTMFLSLTWVDLIPLPLTCLILVRDIVLVFAASYIRYRSLPEPKTLSRYFDATHATAQLAPTLISKFNTGVQLLLVAVTLSAPVFNFVDHKFLQGLWYLTALTTTAGGISYLISKDTYKILSKNNITSKQSSYKDN